MEPLYQGDPILAVAATDETTAVAAIEAVSIDFEPLPFVINPLDSLRPDGPNARTDGNVWLAPGESGEPSRVGKLKWTQADFAAAGPDRLPLGKAAAEWSFGDVAAGLKKADLLLDETFVTPNVSHQALEPRSALAWWENGKLHLVTGTQSTIQTVPALARWLQMDASDIVFISEYTGGGFGGKGTASVAAVIPALLAKKARAPVMIANPIEGKVVVITGASSGLGEATATLLSAQGAIVVLGARRAERLRALADALASKGGKALAVTTDVTNRDAVKRLVDTTVSTYGRIDVMNEEAHIEQNLAIASEAQAGSLTEEELELVDRVGRTYKELMQVGCTGCGYCMFRRM